jgi:hypothetical protein
MIMATSSDFTFTTTAGTTMLTNILSYWKLDEASGVRADSVSVSSNNLTVGPADHVVAGKIGNAFKSNNDTWLTIADNASFNFTGDVTISGWLKVSTTAASIIVSVFSKWSTDGARQVILIWNGYVNEFQFTATSNGLSATAQTAHVAATFVLDQWYFVIGWYDNTAHTLNIQVGTGSTFGSVASQAFTGPIAHTSAGVQMPSYYDGTGYTNYGAIDEIGVWTRVLTAGERSSLFNGGAGLSYPF